MRDAVLSVLPEASLELLAEIEDFAGMEIKFAGKEALPRPVEDGIASTAVYILHDSATVIILDDDPDPAGITHEFHHVQRHWCEQIPQIMPNLDHKDNWAITEMIDGPLEHMIIIPKDTAIGFPTPEKWNDGERPNWETYPWPNIKGQLIRRMKVFAGWLACMEYVTDKGIIDQAIACISEEGLLSKAKSFHEKILDTIHHKPSAFACFLSFLELPRDAFSVVTFDVRNRQRIVEPVPEY